MQATRILTSVIIYVFFLSMFIKQYRADIKDKNADNLLKEGRVERALKLSRESTELNPAEPSYKRTQAKVIIAGSILEKDKEKKSALKKIATEQLLIAQSTNPNNPATNRNSLPLFYYLAKDEVENNLQKDLLHSPYLTLFKEYSNLLENKHIEDVGVLTEIAYYQKNLSLEEDYLATKNKISKLRPDLLEWHPKLID